MIDLRPDLFDLVRSILGKYVPEREVWVFGSRVNRENKKFSDLDIAIIGETPIEPLRLALLEDDFSESDLPFKVDIIDWAVTSDSFRKIIRDNHEVILPAADSCI